MVFRKDITSYLISQNPKYKARFFRVYEQDGFIYATNFLNNDGKTIDYYTYYSFLWNENDLKKYITETFKVNFDHTNIACKCGATENFSASYGDYCLNLHCNICKHIFEAYSG